MLKRSSSKKLKLPKQRKKSSCRSDKSDKSSTLRSPIDSPKQQNGTDNSEEDETDNSDSMSDDSSGDYTVSSSGRNSVRQRSSTPERPSIARSSVERPSVERSSVARSLRFQEEIDEEDETLFMKDGKLRIDFVLVNIIKNEDEKQKYRDIFEENLKNEGLILEESINKDETVRFVKIHTPWRILTRIAETMKLDMPVKLNDEGSEEKHTYHMVYRRFDYDRSVLTDIPKYFTAWFNRAKQNQFLIENGDKFFSSAQRSNMTNYILENTLVEHEEDFGRGKLCFIPSLLNKSVYIEGSDTTVFVGIRNLLTNGIYTSAFPLHDGDYDDNDIDGVHLRNALYLSWAKWTNWLKFQPLDHIKLYFGERIAFYFAWLGFYTLMLVPAGFAGFTVQIYGLIYALVIEEHSCESNDFTMCPLCDNCPIWKLKNVCSKAKLAPLFDHNMTLVFGVFMALWTVIFEEMWKRQEAKLRHQWHVQTFMQEETIRPQYMAHKGKRATMVLNPEKNTYEPKVYQTEKYYRYSWSLSTIMFALCINIIGTFFIILVRNAGNTTGEFLWFKDKGSVKLIVSITAALLNFVMIIVLGKMYHKMAKMLTDYELHRTDSNWENSYILKLFLFEFINNFTYLFYIAFMKGKFVGYPNNYNSIFGIQFEDCVLDGCFVDLSLQLLFIMIGNLSIKLIRILLKTIFKRRKRKRKKSSTSSDADQPVPHWEKDYTLVPIPEQGGVIDEYLEMVIQYAHLTLFVVAFPLAPLIALLNNVIEIRTDACKFIKDYQRPIARRAQGIHIWFSIMKTISMLAIVTNGCVIGFTSNFVQRMVYRYSNETGGYINFSLSVFNVSNLVKQPGITYTEEICRYYDFREVEAPYELNKTFWKVLAYQFIFIVLFTSILLIIAWLIDYAVPDAPKRVRLNAIREEYFINHAILELGKDNPVVSTVQMSKYCKRIESCRGSTDSYSSIDFLNRQTCDKDKTLEDFEDEDDDGEELETNN